MHVTTEITTTTTTTTATTHILILAYQVHNNCDQQHDTKNVNH